MTVPSVAWTWTTVPAGCDRVEPEVQGGLVARRRVRCLGHPELPAATSVAFDTTNSPLTSSAPLPLPGGSVDDDRPAGDSGRAVGVEAVAAGVDQRACRRSSRRSSPRSRVPPAAAAAGAAGGPPVLRGGRRAAGDVEAVVLEATMMAHRR